jgi:hypothetical protein
MGDGNKYNHAEAFCLMHYQTDDGVLTEVLWNSRDGVTPFIIRSRDGREMKHVMWDADRCDPNFKPARGMRIFVNATEELVTPRLKEYIEKIFQQTSVRQRHWRTREDAFKSLLPVWIRDGEAPWIIEVK